MFSWKKEKNHGAKKNREENHEINRSIRHQQASNIQQHAQLQELCMETDIILMWFFFLNEENKRATFDSMIKEIVVTNLSLQLKLFTFDVQVIFNDYYGIFLLNISLLKSSVSLVITDHTRNVYLCTVGWECNFDLKILFNKKEFSWFPLESKILWLFICECIHIMRNPFTWWCKGFFRLENVQRRKLLRDEF